MCDQYVTNRAGISAAGFTLKRYFIVSLLRVNRCKNYRVRSNVKISHRPAVGAPAYNLSTWEAEARGWLKVQGQPGLQSKTLSRQNINGNYISRLIHFTRLFPFKICFALPLLNVSAPLPPGRGMGGQLGWLPLDSPSVWGHSWCNVSFFGCGFRSLITCLPALPSRSPLLGVSHDSECCSPAMSPG